MLARHHDPIAAIATASGRGAIGIIRISGKGLGPIIEAVCGRELIPREATYLGFLDRDGQLLDQGLALYFPGPRSFTGEDVLELQAHGGPVVLQLLLARCLEAAKSPNPKTGSTRLEGLRVAGPGEFSERAFMNGKLDLARAEAIADLIDASTELAVRSASRSLTGAFSRDIRGLREAMVSLRLLVEATLDFPEEEIDFLRKADASGQLLGLQQRLAEVLRRATQGALLRDGIKVVIAGQPNAGKSSLLNALAGVELAIVTPIAGTTRDKVQQTLQIGGVPLHVIDTAGLRESVDEVEKIGISRAWDEIKSADVVLFLHDLTRSHLTDYNTAEEQIRVKLPLGVPVVNIWNKSDTLTALPKVDGICLSAKTGAGIDQLRNELLSTAGWQNTPEGVYIARARHIQALTLAATHIDAAQQHLLLMTSPPIDLLAEELRLAQNALNEITGEFTSDDLLGEIFSRFCIGK